VYFVIEACWGSIAVTTIQRDEIQILGISRLPHQPSHLIDVVSTPIFDTSLVIVIQYHILESVYFLLAKSQIIRHARHGLLDNIPVFAGFGMQRRVFFLQHIVIVRLHALLLYLTLYIFVLFPCRKWVVMIVS
jgi:hypothetical protein